MYKSMIKVISLNKLNCFLSLLMNNSYQSRIQGRGSGGPGSPLFLDQTQAPRAEKSVFLETAPPLSEGLDPPLHTYNKFTLNLDLNPESDYFYNKFAWQYYKFITVYCTIGLKTLNCYQSLLINSTGNKFPNRDLNPDGDLNFLKNADAKTLSASAKITNYVRKNTSLHIRK